jgi:hypothetical protein
VVPKGTQVVAQRRAHLCREMSRLTLPEDADQSVLHGVGRKIAQRRSDRIDRRGDPGDFGRHLGDARYEQLGLAREVAVERRRADGNCFGDVAHRDVLVATVGEQLGCCLDDESAPVRRSFALGGAAQRWHGAPVFGSAELE